MAKKYKVPKKIAGVKLPKALRRGLRDLGASQTGRTVLIDALAATDAVLAAAQAQSASKTRKRAAKTTPKVGAAVDALRSQAADARAATVGALEEAARSFTEALRRRRLGETPPQATTPPPTATH